MLQNLLQRDFTWCGFCLQLYSSGCMGQLLCALVCPLPSSPPPNPCAVTTHSVLLNGQSFPGVDNYGYSQGVFGPRAQNKHSTSFHPAGLSCPSISTFLENLWLISTYVQTQGRQVSKRRPGVHMVPAFLTVRIVSVSTFPEPVLEPVAVTVQSRAAREHKVKGFCSGGNVGSRADSLAHSDLSH